MTSLHTHRQRIVADVGGLSHLVEAATALSALADAKKLVPSASVVHAISLIPTTTQPALIYDDDDRAGINTDAMNEQITNASIKNSKKDIFPRKLLEILSDSALTDIVSWLPHGRSFVIIRPDLFCDQVLPKYLPPVDSRGSTKYPSFTRKLNRW
jgi:hypothetical protein